MGASWRTDYPYQLRWGDVHGHGHQLAVGLHHNLPGHQVVGILRSDREVLLARVLKRTHSTVLLAASIHLNPVSCVMSQLGEQLLCSSLTPLLPI